MMLARLLCLVLLVTVAPRAFGDERAVAREAYRNAMQHFNLGEYSDALTNFKEAYRHYEDPSFLFNIAQCERLLGHKTEAIRAYKTYLLNDPNASNREEVRTLISKLEEEVRTEKENERIPPQGTLTPGTPTGNSVTSSPLPVEHRATPAYKKWWVWTIVGVAAVGVGVGLGVGLSQSGGSPATATTALGTFHPF
jgi:tetratricopeptide (TPR) repeat protein